MRWPLAILLWLTASIAVNAQTPSTTQFFFPFFADGTWAGSTYRSTLKIMNTNPAHPLIRCVLTQRQTSSPFLGINGDFYAADVFDSGDNPPAITTIILDQFLPWEILQSTAQSGLKSGYAMLTCSGNVYSDLQVSLLDTNGTTLGQTSIPSTTEGRSFEFLLDRRNGIRLAFSLINDSALEGDYTVIARDEFNQEVDRAEGSIGRWSQVYRFADEMLTLRPNFVGSIEVVGIPGSHSYAIGIQSTGTVFTAIAPIIRNQPLGF